jgi:hypothetical protein
MSFCPLSAPLPPLSTLRPLAENVLLRRRAWSDPEDRAAWEFCGDGAGRCWSTLPSRAVAVEWHLDPWPGPTFVVYRNATIWY